MTLTAYMAQVPAVPATGEIVGRKKVLAMDCSATGNAEVADYTVVAYHVENVGAALSGKTVDKEYIGEGSSTVKTGTQRTFSVVGQLLRGDEFHDFINSHAVKYGIGSAVKRGYVFFDAGTGTGEKGIVTIIVNNDGNGPAGDLVDIDVSLNVDGTPDEYTWTAPSTQPES
jgi:hypothetical protein